MAASKQLERVNQIFRDFGEKAKTLSTAEEFRVAYEELTSQFPLDEDITCERVGAGGVPAEWVVAPGAAEDRILVHLHGGGYVIGSTRTHRVFLSRLSRATGARGPRIGLQPGSGEPLPRRAGGHGGRLPLATIQRCRPEEQSCSLATPPGEDYWCPRWSL